MADTVYQVKLDYIADTGPAASAVDSLGFKMISLNQTLDLFRRGWEFTKSIVAPMFELNSTLEQAKIRIAGIANATEGWTTGLTGALKDADDLIIKFREDAAASVATSKDFVDIASRLAPALLPVGKSFEDIRDTTKAIVTGTTALGLDMNLAGDQITRMVMGMAGLEQITFKTLFSGEFQKFGTDFTKMFNQMTTASRLDLIMEKLEKFKDVGAEVEGSWRGVTSTLEELFEIALQDIGKPLFEAITSELQDWNKWILANKRSIDVFISDAGAKLIEVFTFVKDAFKFIVDNREVIMGIAGAFAAMKIGGALQGLAGGVGGALGMKGGGMLVNVVGMSAGVVAMIAAAGLAEQRKGLVREENTMSVLAALDRFKAGTDKAGTTAGLLGMSGINESILRAVEDPKNRLAMRHAIDMNFMNPMRSVLEKSLPPALKDLLVGMRDAGKGVSDVNKLFGDLGLLAADIEGDKLRAALGAGLDPTEGGISMEKFGVAARERAKDKALRDAKRRKMTINVTIIQDFKANANPDRIKVATIKALERVARNRVMPRTAPPVG